MKTYIIINGQELNFIVKETLEDAVTYCQNFCDHSNEVIVREYTSINEFSGARLQPANVEQAINNRKLQRHGYDHRDME